MELRRTARHWARYPEDDNAELNFREAARAYGRVWDRYVINVSGAKGAKK